jgi:sugar/nucleoside kinase (ribokinase family)
MDSTGAGDAFWSGFYLLISRKPSMNVWYRFKISSFKTAKCWKITDNIIFCLNFIK